MHVVILFSKNVTYLSWAEKVNTLPLTSSNSTKPGYFNDSVSNKGNPSFNWPLLMYLKSNCKQRRQISRNELKNALKIAKKLIMSYKEAPSILTNIPASKAMVDLLILFFLKKRHSNYEEKHRIIARVVCRNQDDQQLSNKNQNTLTRSRRNE